MLSFVAGVGGGLLGLGGGVILAQAWLRMGINPLVTTATSSFSVIFTAFSSSFTALIGGNYEMDKFILFLCVGICGGLIIER